MSRIKQDTTMNKIKNKLIKWLGGITVDEYHKVLEYKYTEDILKMRKMKSVNHFIILCYLQ